MNAERNGCYKMEKMLNSEDEELNTVYKKELPFKIWSYHIFAAFFTISFHQFMLSRSHGLVWSYCACAEKFGQSAPYYSNYKLCPLGLKF